MTPRVARRLLLLLLCTAGTGCSSFQTRWKAAASNATAERWEGRWTSEHHQTAGGAPIGGRLRAVIEPAVDRQLTAHFHANWLLFASDYTMTLQPKPGRSRADRVRLFSGTEELPKLFGGTYRYEARLAADRLTARYNSSYDRGTFDLRRVPMPRALASAPVSSTMAR